MHLQALITTTILLLTTSLPQTTATPLSQPTDEFTLLNCPNTTTPTASPAEQLSAWIEFTDLMYTHQRLNEAMTKYVAGGYINHAPVVSSTGVHATLNELTAIVPRVDSQLLRAFVGYDTAGNVFGVAHTRVVPLSTATESRTADGEGGHAAEVKESALVDIIRMVGTCLVEHWDVQQTVEGDEVNPIAFF
ncbi:uncharacterized protein BO97DRAFT_29412 [Aspergillus homomorphus CBS 101889]|uniref:SnoaL-like domain-containing protein n=1 Tax=Aspergillus homomorphus (strain CBS 101889) TaxID=1450537 RepID=A0A395I1I3_ASPHC|nr:hypothetical protein BO97DRAFT_29412 [Aspergillus homomorphus CBS 101889]RAL13920.1 hypothetical protein BO97DRAFT_29412 [Aspergillus homomorphus CBS 101889]